MENEPVARIMDIKYVGGKTAFLSKPNEGRIIPRTDINYAEVSCGLTIIRPVGGTGNQIQSVTGWANMPLYYGDIIRVGKDVQLLIEFFIGGRVGLFPKSLTLIDSNRSVRPVFDETLANLPRLLYESVAFCIPLMPSKFKDEARRLNTPLWIKTNALGIRG